MSELLKELHKAHMERRAKFFKINKPVIRRSKPVIEPVVEAPPLIVNDIEEKKQPHNFPEMRFALLQIIQIAVGEKYGVKISEMISPQQKHKFIKPRHIAMYLAKEIAQMTLAQIGAEFGGRDHTTVGHAYHKTKGDIEKDEALRSEIEELKEKIFANWRANLVAPTQL